MATSRELREQRAALIKEAQGLHDAAEKETRDLTAEETEQFKKLQDEAEQLKARYERQEKLEAQGKELEQSAARDKPGLTADDGKLAEKRGELEVADKAIIRIQPRYGTLRAFIGPDSQRNEADAFAAGHWLRAVLFGNAESREWCKAHDYDTRAAQTGGTAEGGGALVPIPLENRIIDLVEEYGLARRECDIWPMTSDTLAVPRRTGGLTAYFVGDAGSATESTTAWDNVQLTAQKLACLTRIPTSLAEDAIINFADRTVLEIARAFADKEDACLIDGDGTSTYGGMVGIRTLMIDGNHAGSYNDATSGDDQWGEYIIGDLLALMGKTPAYPGMAEKWYCSKIAWAQTLVRLMIAAGGSAAGDVSRGVPRQFIGHDVDITQKMPTSTSALDAVVVFLFGDLRMAVSMGVRRGMTIRQSDQRYLEYDQIGILGTERFDIVVHDIGDASNAGPLVGLRGQT